MKILKGKTFVASFGIGIKPDVNSECSVKGDSAQCAMDECRKKFFSEKLKELEVRMEMMATSNIASAGILALLRGPVELHCNVCECHEIVGNYFIPVEDIYPPKIPTELPEGMGLLVLQGFERDYRNPERRDRVYVFIAMPFGKYKIEYEYNGRLYLLEYEIKHGESSVVHVTRWSWEEEGPPEGFVLPEESLAWVHSERGTKGSRWVSWEGWEGL